ncbi:MAG: 30S ribosomal protein S6 [Candidatus Brocadiales bacterium]|uniref:30S ribosomal protein S6 n=1 Tax=Candidatus Wunengus sp. YC60 TaxID=3367697 RepID=UPI0027136009|nr:30S ribosomal protein S6 [Candidatus Brocadiales bacterium]
MYEGLFLIDNTHANTEWDNVVKHIQDILQKNGAEILKTEKWGEKKLAYKVKGHKRGTYLLIHFNAKNSAIVTIRRDFQLSDYIIRFLIVKDDKIEDLSQIGAVAPVAEKDVDKIPEIPVVDLLEESNVSVKVAEEA